MSLDNFPRPEELWAIYVNYKNVKVITAEIDKTISHGLNRLLIGCFAAGVSVISITSNIIKSLFETGENKHVLYLTDNDNYRIKDLDYLYDRNRSIQCTSEDYQLNSSQCGDSIHDNDIKFYHSSINEFDGRGYHKIFPPDFFDVILLDINNDKDNIMNAKCQNILLTRRK